MEELTFQRDEASFGRMGRKRRRKRSTLLRQTPGPYKRLHDTATNNN
jgi:hypothetical protein